MAPATCVEGGTASPTQAAKGPTHQHCHRAAPSISPFVVYFVGLGWVDLGKNLS